jgi:hypothetical protein
MPDEYDVFLSHNSQDKPAVEEIAARLEDRGMRVWLDKGELRPGFPWQEGLEEGVRASGAVAVFVGAAGLGAWQEPEMRAFLARSRREKVPVIPVLLPGSSDSPQLPPFLDALTRVDLRAGLTEDGLSRMIWGITGTKPTGLVITSASGRDERPGFAYEAKRRAWWSWGVGLSLLVVVLALGTWFWRRALEPSPSPPKPEIYAVRVQVLDPQGRPVGGSKIRASSGNEPHQLPDGWWEVQIPAAKVPIGGQISLWAEHEEWEENQLDLRLGEDPNPQIKIRLKEPETWLRGRVVDRRDRALLGVRVTPEDGAPGEAITDADGRFALKPTRPRDRRIRLRSEYKDWKPGDDFCYTGRDSCTIILEKK